MLEHLFEINKMSLALELAALFTIVAAAFLNPQSKKHKTAAPFVISMMCLTSIAHLGIEYISKSMWADPSTLALGSVIWYLGFAVLDFLFVFFIALICRKLKLQRHVLSDFILVVFFTMGYIQIARYCDRYILETNLASDLYTYSILSFNTMLTAGTCGFAFKVFVENLYIAMKNAKQSERSQ